MYDGAQHQPCTIRADEYVLTDINSDELQFRGTGTRIGFGIQHRQYIFTRLTFPADARPYRPVRSGGEHEIPILRKPAER